MIKQFKKKFSYSKPTIIVAVSGGIDSMVLCHLLSALDLKIAIAHCNFKLRGKASDEDAAFVAKFAKSLGLPFFTTHFETEKIAEERHESIQLVARKLRYEWFEHIRATEGYDYVATAHHLNDSIETFVYNFTKGTGWRGLRGVPATNGHIVRPLLSFSKAEIEDYAKENKIAFREDASNQLSKYSRNKIRLEVVPTLKKINPKLETTAKKTFQHLNQSYTLYRYFINDLYEKAVRKQKNGQLICDLKVLQAFPETKTILFEFFHKLGFHSTAFDQLYQAIESKRVGSQFYSKSHQLLVDRNKLIISKNQEAEMQYSLINSEEGRIRIQDKFFKWAPIDKEKAKFNKVTAIILDLEQLVFPLEIRTRKAGDYFCPAGMKGKRKKIKKFLTDKKLNRNEKSETYLLVNGNGDIIWVLGHRMDERYVISNKVKSVLLMTFN